MAPQLEIIHQAVKYIEDHLHLRVTIAEIADKCGYSLYHFIRLFNKFTHHTPYDYLIRRRLSTAYRDLENTRRTITDISFDYCFENPESFSRAFRRVFGLLPSDLRAGEPLQGTFPIPTKTLEDMAFTQREDFTPPELVEVDEMVLTGLPVVLNRKNKLEEMAQIEQLRSMFGKYGIGIGSHLFSIFSFDADPCQPGYLFSGIKTDSSSFFPPVCIQRIPFGLYARISYEEPCRRQALNYLLFTWLPGARMRMGHHFLMEEYHFDQDISAERNIMVLVRNRRVL